MILIISAATHRMTQESSTDNVLSCSTEEQYMVTMNRQNKTTRVPLYYPLKLRVEKHEPTRVC